MDAWQEGCGNGDGKPSQLVEADGISLDDGVRETVFWLDHDAGINTSV
jgi:hypothetical protein